MSIEVTVDVKSSEDYKTQENVVNSLSSDIKEVSKQNTPEAAALKSISVNGDTLILERVESVGSVVAICLEGQVFETVQTSLSKKESKCGK